MTAPLDAVRMSGGSSFSYAPPPAKEDGARRGNMWRSSEELGDRRKYVELMEDKRFHADKGAVSGELLPSRLGIDAPEHKLAVSSAFLSQLVASSEPAVKRPRMEPTQSVGMTAATYEVVEEEDAETLREWEMKQRGRMERADAAAARRRKKREKKKAKKGGSVKGEANAGVDAPTDYEGAEVDAPTDDEGAGVDAPTDDEGRGLGTPTDVEGAGVDAPTDDEGAGVAVRVPTNDQAACS